MSSPIVFPRITALRPARVVEGGRVAIDGGPFDVAAGVPRVTFAGQPARVAFASPSRIVVEIPPGELDALRHHVRGPLLVLGAVTHEQTLRFPGVRPLTVDELITAWNPR